MTEAIAAPAARPSGPGGKSALLLMAALVVGLVLGIVVAGHGRRREGAAGAGSRR